MVRAGNSSGTGTNSAELEVVAGVGLAPTLITAGAVWRYFDKTNDPGTIWQSNSFNDLAWSNGTARLGYGNDGEVTKVASNRQWTTYFRRQFHIPNPTNVVALDGRVVRDDAAIIYLNGAEIWRDTNITSGVITATTPALVALGGAEETNWITLDLPIGIRSLLVSGWNTIAVEVHNQSLTSSDIGFNFELTGQVIISAPPTLAFTRGVGGLTLAWPADASYFALHSATNMMPPVLWRRSTNAAVLSNSVWTVRPATGSNGNQFFRLQAD